MTPEETSEMKEAIRNFVLTRPGCLFEEIFAHIADRADQYNTVSFLLTELVKEKTVFKRGDYPTTTYWGHVPPWQLPTTQEDVKE